jgi:CheY-like chemotaxis protein
MPGLTYWQNIFLLSLLGQVPIHRIAVGSFQRRENMKPRPNISVLVVCSHEALFAVEQVFSTCAAEVDVCLRVGQALQMMRDRTFDLLLVDMDLPRATKIVEARPKDHRGYCSVLVAITHHPQSVIPDAQLMILQKPFTAAAFQKVIDTAYSLIIREKRLTFRSAVRISATAAILERGERRYLREPVIQDLIRAGLCLKTQKSQQAPVPGVRVLVEFQLPDSMGIIRATGKVAWSDQHGQLGIEFLYIAPAEFKELRDWLSTKFRDARVVQREDEAVLSNQPRTLCALRRRTYDESGLQPLLGSG